MRKEQSLLNPAMERLIRLALDEDIGTGDVTSRALPDRKTGMAEIIAREAGIVCGLPLLRAVFARVDSRISVALATRDGMVVRKNQVLARVRGPVKSILTGERTALNLLSTLSGIATQTRAFVNAVRGTRAGIFDTRKTPPGLRFAAKYAVRMGGGCNHRQGLYDMVLIKDNHIAALGLTEAVRLAKKRHPGLKAEVETETLLQFQEALKTRADIIMLDNMTLPRMRKAVSMARRLKHRPSLEASGGVTIKNVRQIAKTGVDRIAVGSLTHSFKILDVSMEMAR